MCVGMFQDLTLFAFVRQVGPQSSMEIEKDGNANQFPSLEVVLIIVLGYDVVFFPCLFNAPPSK